MGTVNKFEAKRLLDPANAALDGQARVNAEIFTAVEILGRKLERVEAERDRLARRLALIESAATVDEKTGKLYLPVVMNQENAPPARDYATPRWIVAASLMSSAVALFALGLVLFRAPAPALTKDQLALLDSLRGPQFTQLSPESSGWKDLPVQPQENAPVASASGETPNPSTPAPAAQLPNSSELATLEQTAVAPKPVEAQTITAAIATPVTAAPPLPSTAPLKLSVANKTQTPDIASANKEDILIPGEDDIPENAPVKAAKKAPAPAPTPAKDQQVKDQAGDKDKTATVVQTSEDDGGIAPDTTLADKLAKLQKRAYEGVPEAQHDLATIYAAGTVVPQDYHRAAFWFTKAADAGVANANYNMGVIYHQGLGVPVDLPKALNWYEKAAELGHPEAMYNLGIAYIEGVGTKVDIEKGVSYFKRAANAGVVQAAYNLGVLYESNFIGPIDTKKAIEWYQIAAKQGHAGAEAALSRLQAAAGAQAPESNIAAERGTPASGDQAQTLEDKVEPAAGNGGTGAPQNLLADIQRILIKQGLLPGQADGVMNQQTEDVIRATQKKLGMTEDGQPSQELLDNLLQLPPVENQ